MKLSLDWLSDFVDLSGLSADEIAERLSMGAFEVEEIKKIGPDIEGPLLVGEILEINPHPNADKIRLTKIRIDDQGPRDIVCGAWNIEVGQKIPVALPGARVLNRHDGSALHIKESKIRGAASCGMLCSAPELGLSGSGEGILILPPETVVGADARDLLAIKNDYVLIVEPRSNRGDALSVLGLAREVAALFKRPLKAQPWLDEFAAYLDEMEKEKDCLPPFLDSTIEDLADCPFFSIRTLAEIKIGPSSELLRSRLEAVGISLINNIVDISNYVLQELGQPLHAYDLGKISGDRLIVRRAKAGEELKTLDEKQRSLNEEVLVIADQSSLLGLAGLMGGKESEVSEETSAIALEAAAFAPARVRRASRLLGLSSDSSLRFERAVDVCQVSRASDRAAYLAVKYCGAKLGPMSKQGSEAAAEQKVQLRMSELKRICEIDLSPDLAQEMLEPLGFEEIMSADDYSAGVLTVKVPSFRQKDVTREIDLIEEISRIYGYDRLPVSMPKSTVAAETRNSLPEQLRQIMIAQGFSEAWISSLVSFSDLSAFKLSDPGDHVAVRNPLSAEHQVLRRSLLPGLLRAVAYNLDHGNLHPCLFELGKIYKRSGSLESFGHKETGTEELSMLSAVMSSERQLSSWLNLPAANKQAELFFRMKGILISLCRSLRIPISALRFSPADELKQVFHPGRSAQCFVDLNILAAERGGKKKNRERLQQFAVIGELHPAVCDSFSLSGTFAAMEISLAELESFLEPASFREIYQTPSTSRDLTVDVALERSNQEIELQIRASADQRLRKLELVSVFQPSQSKKSLSYRLLFQDPQETLKADEIDAALARIRQDLSDKLQAEFRL